MVEWANYAYWLLATAVVLVYLPSSISALIHLPTTWREWREGTPKQRKSADGQMIQTALTLGILLAWVGAGGQRAWWIAWREVRDAGYDQTAQWFADTDWQILIVILVYVGGILHLAVAIWRYGWLFPLAVVAVVAVAAQILTDIV